jgi:hypothetical protein
MVMSEPGDKPVKRRDFLGIAAFGTFLIASATACFGGGLKLESPRVFSWMK